MEVTEIGLYVFTTQQFLHFGVLLWGVLTVLYTDVKVPLWVMYVVCTAYDAYFCMSMWATLINRLQCFSGLSLDCSRSCRRLTSYGADFC